MRTGFVIVNPHKRSVETFTCEHITEAQRHVGLSLVDHGVIAKGLGYCVDEHGLFKPASQQAYFSMFRTLVAGPAVFYGFDERGETLNLRASEFPDVQFYHSINDVEAAIRHEEIERPFMAVNGVEFWHWPQQPPEGMR